MLDLKIKMHSVSRIYAYLSIVHITYTVDKGAHIRETKCTLILRLRLRPKHKSAIV